MIRLFRIRGVPVGLDAGWLAVYALVAWSLASGYFPAAVPTGSPAAGWTTGVVGVTLLFASVLLHELTHAIVAAAFGVSVAGITLHVFGGVAELESEPPSPGAETAIAVAGPAISAGVGVVLLAFRQTHGAGEWMSAVLGYLGVVNLAIALFNLVPGFPLDGGRVLRALLWWWSEHYDWATRVAARAGMGFGLAIAVLGLARLVGKQTLGGAWFILLGAVLFHAARGSAQVARLHERLAPIRVEGVMMRAPVAVAGSAGVDDVRRTELAAFPFQTLPVVAGDTLVGFLRRADVEKHRGRASSVVDVMIPLADDHVVAPGDSAWLASMRLSRNRVGAVAVVDAGHVVGLVTRADLAKALAPASSGRDLDRAA